MSTRVEFKPYGTEPYISSVDGSKIFLWRGKYSSCQWRKGDGTVVSEQPNVAPALVWAMINGYFDPQLAAAGIFPRFEQYAPKKWREVRA